MENVTATFTMIAQGLLHTVQDSAGHILLEKERNNGLRKSMQKVPPGNVDVANLFTLKQQLS